MNGEFIENRKMVGRGKVKYKDVVKKTGISNFKKNQRKPKNRKTYSLYKSDFQSRKTKSINSSEDIPLKKVKIEKPAEEGENSSSEDEVNELRSLISTFKNNDKRIIAIESSSESDIEEHKAKDSDTNIDKNEEEFAVRENQVDYTVEIIKNNLHNSKIESTNNGPNKLEESEIDLKTQNEDDSENNEDPFIKHFSYDLHESLLESLQKNPVTVKAYTESWPQIGNLHITIAKSDQQLLNINSNFSLLEKKRFAPESTVPKLISKNKTLQELFIKSQIIPNINEMNKNDYDIFSPLQLELFSIINNYQDLYFPQTTFSNQDEIRFIYCLHAVNHVLKTRIKVIHHNAKLLAKKDVPDEFRDQGLTRPKVLIVLPFKHSAYKVILLLIQMILSHDNGNVMNKNRFLDDYTGNDLILPKKNPKPEDYEQIFQGNTSDDFKIGITVTKKSLKLYADFYSSDIILASPLGLRTIIGAEGETERDYDFLASIELLIMDQTELFLTQNWDHVIHILNHMHLQPKDSHGTDFSRVRSWSLNGWAKYYRQTLIFSSLMLPEINAIFNKKCHNYAGKVKVVNPIQLGCIGQIVVQVPHIFQRFDLQNASDAIDKRFEFFLTKVLPQQRENFMKQTLIYIPSYFDYVRIRNYFKKEDIGFVQICEYTKDAKVARARDMFFHGDVHFLLYTERYHFFNRKRIKGIRHIVFYQLPTFPHFYYEMCNLMQEAYQNKKFGNSSTISVTALYSKYDIHQLSAIVGNEKAVKMCQSDRKVHMMITGKD